MNSTITIYLECRYWYLLVINKLFHFNMSVTNPVTQRETKHSDFNHHYVHFLILFCFNNYGTDNKIYI